MSNSETYDYHLGTDFFNCDEQNEVRAADVDVRLTVTRRTEDILDLRFVCDGHVTVGCDRCLDDLTLPAETLYEVTVKMTGEEFDDSNEHVLVVPASWTELDVAPLMRDTVLLCIPLVHCHPEGQCNRQMSQLLESISVDEATLPEGDAQPGSGGDTDPRWDTLRELIENNNNK